MNIPPAIIDLRVQQAEGRSHHVWLPLFLLWPLVLALAIICLVLTACVDAALIIMGRRYHHYTLLVARALGAMTETRGMIVRVRDGRSTVDLTVM